MTFKKQHSFIIFILFFLMYSVEVFSQRLYELQDTTPESIIISGVFHPTDNRVLHGDYDATLQFYNEDASVPTVSTQYKVSVHKNYYRFLINLKSVLFPMFLKRKPIYLRMIIENEVDVTLPFASIPMAIKSAVSTTSNRMMDDNVFSIDYKNNRIGIGTSVPSSTVHVVGTVNASQHIVAEGSRLTNLKHAGGDNYNSLRSFNGNFNVITVNARGQMMIGARQGQDTPSADLQVYGSLLVEPNPSLTSNMVEGAGSRWMWYSDRSVLRIGYTPSIYWDDKFSGDHSIAFGYATQASGTYSIVSGGYYNRIMTANSIITGGSDNKVFTTDSIILGGQKNEIVTDNSAVILGGFHNNANNRSIILGGYDNFSNGNFAVVAGFENSLSGDNAIILGGKNNTSFSEESILIGSNITSATENVKSVLFGASDTITESIASSHILINAPNGFSLGTNVTSPNVMRVNGSITSRLLYGDASRLVNVKNQNSAWTYQGGSPQFLSYNKHLGVGTDQLLEALNVSGSINLSGKAENVPGTIRYLDDEFSVYKSGKGWISLEIVDTNTTYNVDDSLALHVSPNVFYVATKNAITGHVKRWNGTFWESNFLDQFIEEAEPSRLSNLPLPKRLFLPTGNVAINIPLTDSNKDLLKMPFAVMSDQNQTSGAYLYARRGDVDRHISISADPPGFHFQGYFDGSALRQNTVDGGGVFLGGNGLTFYVDDSTGAKQDILMLGTRNVDILGVEPSTTNYSFYLGGDLGTKSLVFRTDLAGVGVHLRAPLFAKSADKSVILNQKHNGELFIQSGDKSGDIIFKQANRISARLKLDSQGNTLFGLTERYIRSALDVADGHIHVTEGHGIEFRNESQSPIIQTISFQKTLLSETVPIVFQNPQTSANLGVFFKVATTGNVSTSPYENNPFDMVVQASELVPHTTFQIDTVSAKSPGVIFYVDGVGSSAPNNTFTENGETYGLKMKNDQLIITEDDTQVPAITITPTGSVGLFDPSPTASLSIQPDIVMLNQKGVYFNELNGSSGPAIQVNTNKVNFKSSDEITVLDANQNISMVIGSNGVALNRNKLLTTIESQAIGLEVSGNVVVSGDIYNVLNDKIYPFDVNNKYNTKPVRTVNTIQIDTASGLTLNGNNTTSKLTVKGEPYYNRVHTPKGILVATKNMDLRLIGKGITVSANNQPGRGNVNFNDTLTLTNDIISGGVISGNLKVKGDFIVTKRIRGNAFGLRNIPFRWQHVTRNSTAIPDPPHIQSFYADAGEIYYTSGNVGIGTTEPKTLFEVVGKAQIDSLVVTTNLLVSDIKSSEDISITSKGALRLRSNNDHVIFGRNAAQINDAGFREFMRFNKDSQWIIGPSISNYLVDVGQSSPNDLTEFRIESDLNSSIDFTRIGSNVSASIRFDDTGSRYSNSFTRNNIQIESSDGIGFFTQTVTKSLTIDTQGHVGIFTNTPQNSLDVNGTVSIGYDQAAPANSMIVQKKVGVGMQSSHLPLYELEVSGSALVGNPSTIPISSAFFINGDGTYQLLAGGHPIGNELVMASPNISIKNGWLMINQGIDPGMQIIRDNTTSKIDKLYQLESGKGLNFIAKKDISFQTYDGTNWTNEMVIDSAGKFGIGTAPSEVLHVKDDDSDTVIKLKSASSSLIELKKDSYRMVFGSDSKGFHINTHSATLANPELTIVTNLIGINQDTPNGKYRVDVNGIINATDYIIEDQFHSTGFKSFQQVPNGVVILWLEDVVPEGWEECNGQNGCKKFDDYYVKSIGSGSNIDDTGGSNDGETSATTHEHNNSAAHYHQLNDGTHNHSQTFNSKSFQVHSGGHDGFAHLRHVGHNEYTLFNGKGHHNHYINYSHDHGGITFTGGGHRNLHGNSPNETHNHGENTSSNGSNTIGEGINASGTDGDAHKHTFNNRPESVAVKFIIKVAESL